MLLPGPKLGCRDREKKGKPRLHLRRCEEDGRACFRKGARLIIRVSAILASANKDQHGI